MKKVFIIIPAYNEVKMIGKVISQLRKLRWNNIIVVDDGSTDFTHSHSESKKVIVLRHIINRGKGAAIRTGIEAAKLLNADIIVTCDADGQHSPKDIKKIIDKIHEGYDVVSGSRLFHPQNMPWIKRIANYTANLITWMLYGIWVSDSQSGLRAYSKNVFMKVNTVSDRYEFESEILREIKKYNFKFTEIPIKVIYTKYSTGKSNKQSLSMGIKTLFRLITFS